jgi:hypothetical protein
MACSYKAKTRDWNTGIAEGWNHGSSREEQSTDDSKVSNANIPFFQNSIIPI